MLHYMDFISIYMLSEQESTSYWSITEQKATLSSMEIAAQNQRTLRRA